MVHFSRNAALGLGLATLTLLGLAAPRPAAAQTLYGVTYLDNQLISIDRATGAGALIGSLSSSEAPFGLAVSNGRLLTFDSSAGVVRQLSPTTGANVATFNVGLGPGAVLGQGGLAFDGAGVGYLTSALDPATFSPANDLYRLNLTTGTSTLIAHTADTIEALAFGPTGTLYGLGQLDGNLYAISTATGATTLIGTDGVSTGSTIGSLTFAGNTLYATIDDSLYTLSTTTGAATAVNPDPSVSNLIGFSSISGLAPAPAPEPSEWAALGLGALGLAGLTLRARRRPAR